MLAVFVIPKDASLEGKLAALPVLLNIGSLLDLLVYKGSQICSGAPLVTILFFLVVKLMSSPENSSEDLMN